MRLSHHCHAVLGFAYVPPWAVNAGFVCGEERTLVVDSGPSALAAETIVGYAQAARPGQPLVAINTERHLDHVLGNGVLRAHGIDVYGHPSIRRSEADLQADVLEYCASVQDPVRRDDGEGRIPFLGTHVVDPNLPLDREQTIDLGGLVVSVLLVPGHTPANLAVWVPDDGVMFTGDTVVSDYQPNLGGGGPSEWRQWLAALARVEALAPATLVPGHGRVLRGVEVGREIGRVRSCLEAALAAPGAL